MITENDNEIVRLTDSGKVVEKEVSQIEEKLFTIKEKLDTLKATVHAFAKYQIMLLKEKMISIGINLMYVN